VVSIVYLAESIKAAAKKLKIDVEIKHIQNPRVEKEEHEMTIDTSNFTRLLPQPKYNIASGVYQTLKSLIPYKKVIEQYKDRFIVL